MPIMSMPSGQSEHARVWAMPLLIAACIVLQPLGKSANVPMLILAGLGVAALVRDPRAVLQEPAWRTLLALSACLGLPLFLALPDAYDFPRGLETALAFALFPCMGLVLLRTLAIPGQEIRVLAILGPVLAFWSVDGLVQAITGSNLFGRPHFDGHLTGVFHPKQRLGMVLAVLAPVFLLWLSRYARRRPWLWLLVAPYVLTILLSGKRSAWIMLAAAVVAGAFVVISRLSPRRRLAGFLLICLLALSGIWGAYQSPHFRAKAEDTAALFSGDAGRADAATSYRLTIWRVAADIYAQHWLNGIGARSFRKVYPDYAQAGDFFLQVNPESGPTHPHQIVLEIAVETGTLGLFGYLLLWAWLLREFSRANRVRANAYLAWLCALGVAIFPLNTGHALYDASFWGGITFWLLYMALSRRPAPLSA